jgi:hypothetical protein
MRMVKMSRSSRRKQYLATGYPLYLRVGQEAPIRTWDIVFVSSFMCRLVDRQGAWAITQDRPTLP